MGTAPIDWEDLAFNNGFYGDEAMLRAWYWDDGLGHVAIGEKLGINSTTVRKRMQKLGIELRPLWAQPPGKKRRFASPRFNFKK
jgi:hypothetical protein